jgi:DNA-binding SARP family transcriptional activator
MGQSEHVELARSDDREPLPELAGGLAQFVINIAGGRSVLIGLETTDMPYTAHEWEFVRRVATFIGSWLGQETARAVPERRSGALPSEVVRLSEWHSSAAAIDDRLDVYALGTLRAERGGLPVKNWGGPKAGTRQAQAIFAFLFDRGERGAQKDEIIELIWPDVELERADLAFHRTLGGLRRTLSPSGGTSGDGVISFRNDRYHLNPELVRWSDVYEFEEQLDAACTTGEPAAARRHLDRARRLYRGDYLDDCPFYGDSVAVEEGRQLFRGRHTDALMALAHAHEQVGNPTAALGLLREALARDGTHCPTAEQALIRLQGSARPRIDRAFRGSALGRGGRRRQALAGATTRMSRMTTTLRRAATPAPKTARKA